MKLDALGTALLGLRYSLVMGTDVPRQINPSCEALVRCRGVKSLEKQAKTDFGEVVLDSTRLDLDAP